MAFRRVRAFEATERQASKETREEAKRRALVEDGLNQLVATVDALSALEARLQLVEDDVTGGDALELPRLPTAADVGVTETEPRLLEAALLIGAITRRMNLRLGAMERALDELPPFDAEDTFLVRAPAQFEAMREAERRAGAA